MDWPLSREEKHQHVLKCFDKEVKSLQEETQELRGGLRSIKELLPRRTSFGSTQHTSSDSWQEPASNPADFVEHVDDSQTPLQDHVSLQEVVMEASSIIGGLLQSDRSDLEGSENSSTHQDEHDDLSDHSDSENSKTDYCMDEDLLNATHEEPNEEPSEKSDPPLKGLIIHAHALQGLIVHDVVVQPLDASSNPEQKTNIGGFLEKGISQCKALPVVEDSKDVVQDVSPFAEPAAEPAAEPPAAAESAAVPHTGAGVGDDQDEDQSSPPRPGFRHGFAGVMLAVNELFDAW